jgi:hypothetical protein
MRRFYPSTKLITSRIPSIGRRGSSLVVYAQGLEYWMHMVAFGRIQGRRVWLRCIQEDRRTQWCMATKSAEQRISYILQEF